MANAEGMTPEPTAFEVAEYDGLYVPATARAEGDTIVLTFDSAVTPRLVRYGWQPYSEGNLTNGAGLPASTFKIAVE